MTQKRAWDLFFLTGLPEAYLAACGEQELENRRWENSKTAFSHLTSKQKQPK